MIMYIAVTARCAFHCSLFLVSFFLFLVYCLLFIVYCSCFVNTLQWHVKIIYNFSTLITPLNLHPYYLYCHAFTQAMYCTTWCGWRPSTCCVCRMGNSMPRIECFTISPAPGSPASPTQLVSYKHEHVKVQFPIACDWLFCLLYVIHAVCEHLRDIQRWRLLCSALFFQGLLTPSLKHLSLLYYIHADLKELIPEFFTGSGEFLTNFDDLDLGHLHTGTVHKTIGSIDLLFWCFLVVIHLLPL